MLGCGGPTEWRIPPQPAPQRSPVPWARQRVEMGSFHSSLPFLSMSQERARRLYRSRACHSRTGSMASFRATHSGHYRNMGCPSWHPPPQAAGAVPNFVIWEMLWGAACGGVSSPGTNALMGTMWLHFRSLCAGKPGEMCVPVQLAHSSHLCECSQSKGCCSLTLLTLMQQLEEPAQWSLFWEKTLILHVPDEACSQEPAYTAQQNPLCAIRSLLLTCVWHCRSFLLSSY